MLVLMLFALSVCCRCFCVVGGYGVVAFLVVCELVFVSSACCSW